MSYNQPQVAECDTLFILCARTDVSERAEEYLKATGAESVRQMLTGFISYLPDKTAWAARQAYIALGFGLAAAAELGLASCPMEGFSSQDVAKHLKLADNLVPVAYLAVGSHAEDKSQAEPYPRFRFPESDLVQRV
jgi:nitroreductase